MRRHETFTLPDPFPAGPKPRKASSRELIERVGAWHGIDRKSIIAHDRRRPVVAARFDAIAAVKIAYPHLSMPAIGRLFGGRDHTTIWHALKARGLK